MGPDAARLVGAHEPAGARINQSFLRRTVLFMVDSEIRQFLDLGSGLPNVGTVHELVEHTGCRVVYVDPDPVDHWTVDHPATRKL